MPSFVIDKFLGIYTRGGRDKRPVGAFDNLQNLICNVKTLKASQRTGYTADIASAPVDISTTKTATTFRYPRGVYPATESPSSKNVDVLAVTVSGTNHYFQKPFWHKNNATLSENATRHSDWLWWGEFDVVAPVAKAEWGANTMEVTGLAVTTADYQNGWILCNFTEGEFLYVTDVQTASNLLTFNEDIPSDWTDVASIYVLYRSFHDNPYDPTYNNTGFNPSWTDPVVLKLGNNIVASGGQGSTVGYKPIWSGYVNQTWFPDASRSPSFNQTYVTEHECKNTGTWLNPQAVGSGAGTLTSGNRYWIGFVWESWDGQRSLIYFPSTTEFLLGDGTKKLTSDLYIRFPKMDKRARYVHVFMAETDTSVSSAANIDYADWFFVETHDMCDSASGFTYTNSTTIPGYYTKTIDLDLADWNAVGADLATFLGHTKPNRATASFSYGVVTAGRLFTAKYYDYNASLSYNDSINYTPFAGNGVAQWSKLMDLDDTTQSSIEAGDPASIQGLATVEGKLLILKDSSSFYIDITYDPSQWILNDISRKVGCDAPDSVSVTPFGVVWAKSGDGVYLWRGGPPIELTRNWRGDSTDFAGSTITTGFRNLTTTYKTSWIGWYDGTNRSYRLMYTSDGSTKTTVYEAFLDVNEPTLEGLPIWVKHSFAHNIGHVMTRSDNVVYFSDDSTKTYYFSTATADAGTTIKPIFDTGLYSLGEKELSLFTSFWFKFLPAVNTITGLDILIEVDSTQHTGFTSLLSAASPSKDRIASDLPVVATRLGTTFRFKFNSNATPVAINTAFTALELGFEYEPMERGISGTQSL